MGFIDIEQDESITLSSTDAVQTKITGYEDAAREIRHQQDVEDSTFMEKWSGFSDTWDSTYMHRAIDYMRHDLPVLLSTTVDKKWQMDNTDKVMNERLNDMGIQPKFFRQFADATNEQHFRAITNRIIETQDAERNVADTLNNYGMGLTEQATSSLITGMLDIDIATSGGLAIMNKISSLRTLMLRNQNPMALGVTGIHAATAKIAYETDPNVTEGEALFFGVLGSLVDYGQIKYYNHRMPLADNIKHSETPYKDALNEDLDSIRAGATTIRSAFEDLADKMTDIGMISKDDADSIMAGLSNKAKMSKARFNIKFANIGDGTVDIGGKKFLIASLASMGIAVEAEGSDGMVLTATVGGLMILAAAVGFVGLKSLREASGELTKANAKAQGKKFLAKVKEADSEEALRGALFESYKAIERSITDVSMPKALKDSALDMLNKMLFNAMDGTYFTVDRNANRMSTTWDMKSMDIMSQGWRQWLREPTVMAITKNLLRTKDSAGYVIGSRNQFEQMVFRHMEGIEESTDKFVIKAANDIKGLKDKMNKELVEAAKNRIQKLEAELSTATPKRKSEIKVIINEIKEIPNTVEYNKFRTGNMTVLVNSMDESSRKLLSEQFSAMLNIEREYADMLVADLGRGMDFNKALSAIAEDIFKAQDKKGIAITAIKFDKSKFKAFEYSTVDGQSSTLLLNDLFEINPSLAMGSYAKEIAGNAAMLDAGISAFEFTTLMRALEKAGVDKTAISDLVDSKNIMMGGTILDQNSRISKLRREVSNAVIMMSMPLSALSQIPEALRLLTTNAKNLQSVGQNISSMLNSYKHKGILIELLDEMGLAQQSKGLSFGAVDHIGVDNIQVSTSRVGTVAKAGSRATEIGRDSALYLMVHTSDFLTKMSMMINIDRLSRILNGSEVMSPSRLKIYGLDEATIALLKPKLSKLGDKLGLDKWTREERLAFYKVLDNLVMKDVMDTSLGNSPSWARNSELGAAISLMSRYSMGLVANGGVFSIKGLRNGDKFAVGAENAAMFTGAFVATMVRDSLAGREPDYDKAAAYALLSLGMITPFDVVMSLADPALFAKSADYADVVRSIVIPSK